MACCLISAIVAFSHALRMATPRSKLVDAEHPMHYHIISRCVRRVWLCGVDSASGIDYSYRKPWVEERLFRLAQCFAVELNGYAVMSNHFHLVVYFDPKAANAWSDEEIIERWFHAFPPSRHRVNKTKQLHNEKERMRNNPLRLAHCRNVLGSLSEFMKHLKQPIAWRINREDDQRGHCFEQRFYSGAILSDRALLATLAYVDLNPVRAQIADDITQCQHTSVAKRLAELENTPERIDEYLAPLASGLTPPIDENLPTTNDDAALHDRHHARRPKSTLRRYLELLPSLIAAERGTQHRPNSETLRWAQDVAAMHKRQRAYGPEPALRKWMEERQFRMVEVPMG
jgi:REP element-mobilizing transposase RayT